MRKIFMIIMICLFSFLIVSCANNDLIIEESIILKTGDYHLNGKLTLPKEGEKFPAVVLIGGSGPTDMDSSIGRLTPFKDIAHQLAKKGIASIRYNKRTYEYKEQLVTDYNFTPQDEYVDDALTAIEVLLKDERIDHDNIFLLGHSQGGQFAPVIANQTDKLKGIIIMAGITGHILDLLMEQTLINNGQAKYDEYLPFYQDAKEIKVMDDSKYNWHYFGAYYKYWVEYNKIDFEDELLKSSTEHSVLVMQGGKDLQVYSHYFERYKELIPYDSEYLREHILYPSLNHFFVDGTDEIINNAYLKKQEVDSSVIESIANSIKGGWSE